MERLEYWEHDLLVREWFVMMIFIGIWLIEHLKKKRKFWTEYDSMNSFEIIIDLRNEKYKWWEDSNLYFCLEKDELGWNDWYMMSCCENFVYMEYIWIILIEMVEQRMY